MRVRRLHSAPLSAFRTSNAVVRQPHLPNPSTYRSMAIDIRQAPKHRWVLPFALGVVTTLGSMGTLAILSGCISPNIQMPRKNVSSNPGNHGATYETITIQSKDGTQLSGWFLPAPKTGTSSVFAPAWTHPLQPAAPWPATTVLYFYGAYGNKGTHSKEIAKWNQLGLNVMVIDYRGFGDSQGSTSPTKIHWDAFAAFEYLRDERKIDPRGLVIFGRSLGSHVAIRLAADLAQSGVQIRALITDAGFLSVRDLITHHGNWLVGMFVNDDYNSEDYLEYLTMPKLVIHGGEDPLVPPANGRKLFDAMPEPKTLHVVEKASHDDTFQVDGDGYLEQIRSFLHLP